MSSVQDPHTVIVRQRVPNHVRTRYEAWLEKYHLQLNQQPGLVSVDVIRRDDGRDTQFLVLSAFVDEPSLSAWLASKTLRELRQRLDPIAGSIRDVRQMAGREIWFDNDNVPSAEPAPYWKRGVLSTACVYLLINALELLISRPFGQILGPFTSLLTVFLLSAVLTYPVMPFAVRIARPWLFGKRFR